MSGSVEKVHPVSARISCDKLSSKNQLGNGVHFWPTQSRSDDRSLERP